MQAGAAAGGLHAWLAGAADRAAARAFRAPASLPQMHPRMLRLLRTCLVLNALLMPLLVHPTYPGPPTLPRPCHPSPPGCSSNPPRPAPPLPPLCPRRQAKEEMRAKEALLRNFFCNVEVVLRTQKVAATSQRWEVSKALRPLPAGLKM